MQENIQKKDVRINRFKRIPLIVFLKKSIPIIVFLILLTLSFVFGLWNVRSFEYNDSELINVKKSELDSYVSEYIDQNIFLVKPSDIQKTFLEKNGYIKEVYVKKVLPSKLNITIKEYIPSYLGYSTDRCLLFADSGEMIQEVCKDCKEECFNREAKKLLIYITSESSLENAQRLIFFEEIDGIRKVLTVFEYQIDSIDIKDGIATINDLDKHIFVFDISYELDTQLARMYVTGQKIDNDMIKFRSLDLRFERPVMKLE